MGDSKNPYYYVDKILDDLKFIESHTKGVSYMDFTANDLLIYSVCFKFVQASENAKKISESTLKVYPNIPWNQINGLRNRIVHDYGNIKLDVIYDAATKDVPSLIEALEQLMPQTRKP